MLHCPTPSPCHAALTALITLTAPTAPTAARKLNPFSCHAAVRPLCRDREARFIRKHSHLVRAFSPRHHRVGAPHLPHANEMPHIPPHTTTTYHHRSHMPPHSTHTTTYHHMSRIPLHATHTTPTTTYHHMPPQPPIPLHATPPSTLCPHSTQPRLPPSTLYPPLYPAAIA